MNLAQIKRMFIRSHMNIIQHPYARPEGSGRACPAIASTCTTATVGATTVALNALGGDDFRLL